jgi:hypothetical protein
LSPQDNIRPLNTYLLVDVLKTSRKYTATVEDLVRSFQQHYKQGHLLKHQTITLPQHKDLATEQLMIYRSDLEFGFKQVLRQLPASSEAQNEIFVFLQMLPGGDWMAPLSELAAQGNVWIHIFWLIGNDLKFSLKDAQTMSNFEVDLKGFENLIDFREHVARVLELRTGRAGWVPQAKAEAHPGTAQAVPQEPATPGAPTGDVTPKDSAIVRAGLAGQTQGTIQAAPPAGEEEPRSLQIFVPAQKTAEAESTKPASLSRETIPLEPALSEPAAETSKVKEAEAGSQPEVSMSEEQKAKKESVEKEAQPAEAPELVLPVEESKDKLPSKEGETPSAKVEVEAATRQQAETEKTDQQPAPKAEPEPPVGKDGVASNWKTLDPPKEMEDRVPHTATMRLEAGKNWLMAAASRRGKMHAHQGIFREDAFGLGYAEGWNFMIVADGGGSRSLARVGSRVAAEVGIEAMIAEAKNLAKSGVSIENACRYILVNGISKAYDAIRKEAQNREKKVDDFGTTYLALAHRPMKEQHLLGTLQVGDGLIAAMFRDHPPQVLADPDVGESASQTLFLTSKPWNEWIGRIKVYHLEFEPVMLACMCDGVSDDLIPYKTNLPPLFAVLSDKVMEDAPEKALLDFLGYDKRGSFDDRTLAVIYPRHAGKPAKPPTVEQAELPQPDQPPVKVKTEDAQNLPAKEEPAS